MHLCEPVISLRWYTDAVSCIATDYDLGIVFKSVKFVKVAALLRIKHKHSAKYYSLDRQIESTYNNVQWQADPIMFQSLTYITRLHSTTFLIMFPCLIPPASLMVVAELWRNFVPFWVPQFLKTGSKGTEENIQHGFFLFFSHITATYKTTHLEI